MKSNLQFTARTLKARIKEGSTPEDLCARYNCSIDELKAHLAELYPHGKGAKKIWNDLVANRKISRKVPTEQPATPIDESAPIDANPITEEAGLVAEELNAPEATTLTLEELKDIEMSLSKSVISIETERKLRIAEHHGCIDALRAIERELQETEEHLKSCQELYDAAIKKADDIVAIVTDKINPALREKRAALKAIREQIKKRKTINLFVYEDGRIEAPDHPGFNLDDDGYLELKDKLRDMEECENLRIRDIPILARLLIISGNVEQFELICENEELEKVFRRICGNST